MPKEDKSEKNILSQTFDEPTFWREFWALIMRGFSGLVGTGDTGYTLVKNSLLVVAGSTPALVGLVVGGVYLLPIYITTGVLGIVGIVSNLIDESVKIAQEKESIKACELRDETVATSTELLQNVLNLDKATQASEEDFTPNNVQIKSLNEGQLVKFTLYKYLKKLDLLRWDMNEFEDHLNNRRRNGQWKKGRLPGQNSIIRLIELATGVDRIHPRFADEVRAFLNKKEHNLPPGIAAIDETFVDKVITSLRIQNSNLDTEPPIKEKGRFYRATNYIFKTLQTIAKGNTAWADTIGSSIALGVTTVGLAVKAVVLAPAAALGLLSAAAHSLYHRYVEKPRKHNAKLVEAKTKVQNTRLASVAKLASLREKDYSNYVQGTGYHPRRVISTFMAETLARLKKPVVSTFTKIRMAASTFVQTTYGLSIGTVIGTSVGTVGAVVVVGVMSLAAGGALIALPPLGIIVGLVAAGAAFGALYGVFWAQKNRHTMMHENAEEMHQIKRTYYRQQDLEEAYGETKVNRLLNKTKAELVEDLITSCQAIAVAANHPFYRLNESSNEFHTRKEKILASIEAATGIKRALGTNKLPINDEPTFYNNLAAYLYKHKPSTQTGIWNKIRLFFTGDREKEENIRGLMNSFKCDVLNVKSLPDNDSMTLNTKSESSLNIRATSLATRPDLKKAGISANSFLQKHALPLAAGLGAAILLAVMIIVPALWIPVTIFAVSVACVVIAQKALEVTAERNKTKLVETNAKLSIIETLSNVEKPNKEKTPQKAALYVADAVEMPASSFDPTSSFNFGSSRPSSSTSRNQFLSSASGSSHPSSQVGVVGGAGTKKKTRAEFFEDVQPSSSSSSSKVHGTSSTFEGGVSHAAIPART